MEDTKLPAFLKKIATLRINFEKLLVHTHCNRIKVYTAKAFRLVAVSQPTF